MDHRVNQRVIGQLHPATQGVAEELAAKLTLKLVAPRLDQVIAQTAETVEGGAVFEGGVGVGAVAGAANGVEAFQREPQWIDLLMTAGATGVAAVSLDQLPLGQALRRFVREHGHILRGTGQFFAEDDFADPVAAQDRAGARGPALPGQGGGKSKDAAASAGAQPRAPSRANAAVFAGRRFARACAIYGRLALEVTHGRRWSTSAQQQGAPGR